MSCRKFSDFFATRRAVIGYHCYHLYKTPRRHDVINETVDYAIRLDIIIKLYIILCDSRDTIHIHDVSICSANTRSYLFYSVSYIDYGTKYVFLFKFRYYATS